jgi:hypothetical protein
MRSLSFFAFSILFFFTACIAPSTREQTTESQLETILEVTSESQQEPHPSEPSHEEDGGTADVHPFSLLPCNEVVKTFKAFYEKHNDCEVDDDCRYSAYTLPYGGNGCDCILSISGGPVPLPKKYPEYKILEDRFFSKECREKSFDKCSLYDGIAPNENAKILCKEKQCSQHVESFSCFPSP